MAKTNKLPNDKEKISYWNYGDCFNASLYYDVMGVELSEKYWMQDNWSLKHTLMFSYLTLEKIW